MVGPALARCNHDFLPPSCARLSGYRPVGRAPGDERFVSQASRPAVAAVRSASVAACQHAGVTTVAYTDGACSGNPGPGGWAWAIPGGAFASGAENSSTNQRMEISAAFEATKANPGALKIVSDSTYVVNCFNNTWWEGWLKRGWLNSQKKPVANRDLWEPFIALVRERGDVTFQWVKGHSGDPMNDLVDRLAVEAATTQKGRAGDDPPEDLGPADAPGRRASPASKAAADPAPFTSAVDGHSVVVLGHCLLYTSPSPRDGLLSRMPSSA